MESSIKPSVFFSVEVEPVSPDLIESGRKVIENNNVETRPAAPKGHINVAFVYSTDNLHGNEPPTSGPEKGEEPFHGHLPSKIASNQPREI